MGKDVGVAIAHPNLAFIKYWGKLDSKLNLPMNPSISMNLDSAYTITRVEFSDELAHDEVKILGETLTSKIYDRVVGTLDELRKLAGEERRARVFSKNNFPSKAGLASSASGGAALVKATIGALRLKLDDRIGSIYARHNSGSASRSYPEKGGYVEWLYGERDEDSYAYSLLPPEKWEILDIIAIVSEAPKEVSSREGHDLAFSSPYYRERLEELKKYYPKVKKAILEKDFTTLGKYAEKDALSMHRVMETSKPPLVYRNKETYVVCDKVKEWRKEGIEAYFSIDAGPNVHILTLPEWRDELLKRIENLKNLGIIKKVIVNRPAPGARLVEEDRFKEEWKNEKN